MAVPHPMPPQLGQSPALEDHPPDSIRPRSYRCDSCGRIFSGEPGGAGLFIWTRGEELRYEEPPLCESCAYEISIGAIMRWSLEEEEEG